MTPEQFSHLTLRFDRLEFLMMTLMAHVLGGNMATYTLLTKDVSSADQLHSIVADKADEVCEGIQKRRAKA